MGFLPKGLFGKKIEEITIEPEKPAKPAKTAPLHGPGGKFTSKKKPATGATLTFYSLPIRVVSQEGTRYFVLDDILSLCLDPNVREKFQQLKKDKKTAKKTVVLDNQECATAENVISLVQLLELPFPGPLARWLTQVAQESFELSATSLK